MNVGFEHSDRGTHRDVDWSDEFRILECKIVRTGGLRQCNETPFAPETTMPDSQTV